MRDTLKEAGRKEIVRWTILAKSQHSELGTTKSGTDELKRHMRLRSEDKQAHHCKVPGSDKRETGQTQKRGAAE